MSEPNRQNVSALSAILGEVLRDHGLEGPNGPRGESWWESEDFDRVATDLAARGVLAPSALTDTETHLFGAIQTNDGPIDLREFLQRIASGALVLSSLHG